MSTSSTASVNKTILIVLCLVALGILGNYLALSVAYGVAFIFGSIFSILAIVLLGVGWGTLVAVLSASYTFFLWNHPYALIIFTTEAIWIGLALRRGFNNLVLIDAMFWLSLGSALVVTFYSGVMGLSNQAVLLIVLKQAINGLFNALVASLILFIPAVHKFGFRGSTVYSYKGLIFNTIAFFLMLPMLSILLIDNYRENHSRSQQLAADVQSVIANLEGEVSHWVSDHVRAVKALTLLPSSFGMQPSQVLQEQLGRIKNLYPDFINVYLANQDAITFGFYPSVNEQGQSTIGLNFSDREYFKNLSTLGEPVVSDVFFGRGGTSQPIVTVSVPTFENGQLSHYALGAMDLQRLQQNINEHGLEKVLMIHLVDAQDQIIVSTEKNQKSLDPLPDFQGQLLPTDIETVFLHVPSASTNISMMEIWKNASFFSRMPIKQTNWTLQVEYFLAPLQVKLYESSIVGLSIVTVLLLPLLLIASAISKQLTMPLQRLATISADLPNQIEKNKQINWPKTNIGEVKRLVENFQNASFALSNKIGTLNNRLALATDSAGIGVWDYDVKENKLIWNKWMYRLYGITEDQFSGAYEAWEQGVHPDDLKRCQIELGQALSGQTAFDTELRVVWPTGEIRYIKAIAQVQRDKTGNATRMIGINYDITDRKLSIEKLERAVEKAEVANEAKSEFLANMSHEIRTPMNGVIGMTNLLLRTPLDEQQTQYASTVKGSAESLLGIINDILDFSKVEAGKLHLEPRHFNFHQLIQELMTVMRFRTEEKGLLLTLENQTEDAYWLYADAGRIRQVLTNLLGNAVKFTQQGEIKLSYRLQPQSNHQTLVNVEIDDTGIGLSEDQIVGVFERFQQADGSTTRRYGGTGLGLAISKQLVELMDGDIGVRSQLGKGSTFWFTVLLNNGEAPNESAEQALTQVETLSADGLSGETAELPQFKGKVLVVEDNPINQMVAQSQLEDFGLEVQLANNGQEGVDKLEHAQFDLVFMDCQMPVMDGFEASGLIRKGGLNNRIRADIPIVAMTANVIKGDREKCLDAGMNDYISKPVSPEAIVRVLYKWLGHL